MWREERYANQTKNWRAIQSKKWKYKELSDLGHEVFEDQIMISWVGDIGLRFGGVLGWLWSVWGDGDFRVGKIVFVKGDHINNKGITEAFKLQIVIDGTKLDWNKDNDIKDLFDWGWLK